MRNEKWITMITIKGLTKMYDDVHGIRGIDLAVCCQPHNSSGPISSAVAVQLDACMTNFIIQEIFPFFNDGRYSIVDDAYEQKIQNGYITISNRKGLGIELDEEYVNKFDHIAVK
jgi:galactonate dehydratase